MGKRLLSVGLACLALALAAPAVAQGQPAPEASVDIAAIPGVISDDAQWQALWSGPMIVDGMTADAEGNLLFAQEQSNSIVKVWPDGKWWVQWPFVAGAGSVSIDSQGRTFAADRSCTDPGLGLGANCTVPSKIVQLTPERKTVADKFPDGTTLGRINDLAADGLGGAYFTERGLFHARADGSVDTIIAAPPPGPPQPGGVFTNGLVLSPDGKTLYVTNRTTILAFDVGADGALSNRRDFATLAGESEGSFGGDGLAVDAEGRLYVTAGSGVVVIDKTGQQLGVIPTPRRSITTTFGGPNRKTLYIGTLGATTPTGENWATPQGVRNIAATIYAVPVLTAGVRR